MEYYFSRTLKRHQRNTLEGKKQIAAVLLKAISKLSNAIEQTHWLQELSGILDVPEGILREQMPSPGSSPTQAKEEEKYSSVISPQVKSRRLMLEERILAIALKFPKNLKNLFEHLDAKYIENQDVLSLYKNLNLYYTKNNLQSSDQSFHFDEFSKFLTSHEEENQRYLGNYADTLFLLAEKDFYDFEVSVIKNEIHTIAHSLKKEYLTSRLKSVSEDLRNAEINQETEKIREFSEECNKIIGEINLMSSL